MLDFGLEIECLIQGHNQDSVAATVAAAGVPCRAAGYNHALDRNKWKVVSDASVRGIGTGFELVSPPLTEAGFDQIEKVCAALAALGATINRTCGLHVHIGARHYDFSVMKKLAQLYYENEPVIDSLLPTSRRGNSNNYCKSLKYNVDVNALQNATDMTQLAVAVCRDPDNRNAPSRFTKLNFCAFWRHGTVEFRHHSGSIEAQKIIKWIQLCSKLVDVAVATASEPVTLLSNVPPAYNTAYWRRGRRTRLLFEMLTRPEGVTMVELQAALNRSSRPSGPAQHATRSGDRVVEAGRRGGATVYKLAAPQVAVAQPTEPATFESFVDKLGFSDEEKSFWAARKARLETAIAASSTGYTVEAVA